MKLVKELGFKYDIPSATFCSLQAISRVCLHCIKLRLNCTCFLLVYTGVYIPQVSVYIMSDLNLCYIPPHSFI